MVSCLSECYLTPGTLRAEPAAAIVRITHPACSFAATAAGPPRRGPRRDLAPVAHAQLGEYVLDMVLRGAFGDNQRRGDLPVGQTPADQLSHLGFARAEVVAGVARWPQALAQLADPPREGRHLQPRGGRRGLGKQAERGVKVGAG